VIAALGRGHASKNQLPEAEAAYKRAIELQKTNPQPYFELYGVYLLQKRLPEAEAVLRTGFANNPKQYRFLMDLAFHYYAQNRREEMVKVLDELKSRHQDYKQAYITAGDFYLRLRDPEGAIAQYQQGMEADEEQKSTYQKRIIEVLMRQGKRAEAARLNEEILKAKPDDPDARGLQASLMLERGDVQKAMDDLQQVVRSAPENFVARFNLGRAHMAKGEVEQARQQFEQAVRLRPDYIPPQLALAHLHITRREFDMALRTTAQILARDRNNMGALLLQSAALMGQGKFQDSRDLLQQMLNASPNSADVWFQLGMVNLVEKRFREAEAGFQKAYDLSPSNPRGLLGVVETYLAQGRVDAGIQKLQAEAQKHPERSDFHLMLGNTAVRTGRLDLAIENFNRLVAKVDPKSRVAADAYLRLGESYRRKGDLASGIAALNKASEIVPNDAVIVGTLALTLDGAGRRDEAKRAYEDVIKLNPNHAIALNNLAFLMAETGDDLNQALTYAQRAKQRLPQIDEVSDTLGWIYLKKNLSEDAVLIFQDLVKKAPKHPTYRYHLGMALSQKGDKTNAIRELQEALKNKPQREEEVKIKELLERLG
jgi:tetratricopeptide (TPR) repeat protein